MAGVAFASGAALVRFDTIDSTSLEAKRRAADGERGPLWIMATEQTAGYGRRGSAWEQRAGDLAATFLFDPEAPTTRIGELSFVAALAVVDAFDALAPKAPLALKWPNDVLAGGAKIAGLLLELVDAPAGPLVAFGVGINVVSAPDVADYPTARLIDFCERPPAPAQLLRAIDEGLMRWRQCWRRDGFAPVRTAWLARAAGLGATIRVRLPGEIVEGVFADLDSDGALVLECGNGRRRIAAGTVLRT